MTILDGPAIRARRQTLGLSARRVADHLGCNSPVVAAIEAGTNHDDLPLQLLVGLAEILRMPLTDLFTADATATQPGHDAARLGAALAHTNGELPADAAADALGITLDELAHALTELDAATTTVGMRCTDDGILTLVPAATVPDEQLRALVKTHLARRGLNPIDAQLLVDARDGTLTNQQLQGRRAALVVGRLRNAGYLTREDPPVAIDQSEAM